jgi:hypothetical protein
MFIQLFVVLHWFLINSCLILNLDLDKTGVSYFKCIDNNIINQQPSKSLAYEKTTFNFTSVHSFCQHGGICSE